MICAKFGWNWPSDSWEEDENVKKLQTDDGQQAIRKAQLSFQLRWVKKRQNYQKNFKIYFKNLLACDMNPYLVVHIIKLYNHGIILQTMCMNNTA